MTSLHMVDRLIMLSRMWVIQVDIGRRLGVFALRLDESGLKVDDVLAQRVILRLDRLVIVLQCMQFPNLFLELLNVSFLALSKGSL